ncbi:UNVERIFIED_CONTAM: hypothetical protein FKN15_061836 [Acipenser sinensis]
MPYTDLIREWHAAVQAVDEKDWVSALGLLENISEPTSKIFFTAASVHLVLGQLEQAIKALDRTIAKDERLAVGFFQRGAVHMLAGRLEEALSDCSLALKHFRGNSVIDYRQLGLRYQLHSWQGSSELEVQEGEVVFVLDSGKDGWAVVIHDGKKASSFSNGIPLPPDLKPPTRPQSRVNLELPKLGSRRSSLADSRVQTPLSSERRPSLPGTTHQSHPLSPFKYEDPLASRPILYQVVALYDYESQGPEDLEFSKGDTIDILSEVNDEWLEGHTAGNIGIFPRCFIYQDTDVPSSIPKSMPT